MPASPDPAVRSAHARIAARKRWHGADADLSELERDLRVARAAAEIDKLFGSDPAPTLQQSADLARRILAAAGGAA
jgi:hypothetical protein